MLFCFPYIAAYVEVFQCLVLPSKETGVAYNIANNRKTSPQLRPNFRRCLKPRAHHHDINSASSRDTLGGTDTVSGLSSNCSEMFSKHFCDSVTSLSRDYILCMAGGKMQSCLRTNSRLSHDYMNFDHQNAKVGNSIQSSYFSKLSSHIGMFHFLNCFGYTPFHAKY